jgi:hypothetical protein
VSIGWGFQKQYHAFLPLCSKEIADELPPQHPGSEHGVRLRHGETPSGGPLYEMSKTELVVLDEWLKENMSKQFIRQSSSQFAAPVLSRKKPDGGLPFCIDYRDINSKTIKNQYPLLLITEVLNLLRKVRIYTNLNV